MPHFLNKSNKIRARRKPVLDMKYNYYWLLVQYCSWLVSYVLYSFTIYCSLEVHKIDLFKTLILLLSAEKESDSSRLAFGCEVSLPCPLSGCDNIASEEKQIAQNNLVEGDTTENSNDGARPIGRPPKLARCKLCHLEFLGKVRVAEIYEFQIQIMLKSSSTGDF